MQYYGKFMVVKKVTLPKFPKAFQDYVHQYFKEVSVFGNDCYVAFLTLGSSECLRGDEHNDKKGVAPAHSSCLTKFSDGLPRDMDLAEWMNMQVKNKEEIFSFYSTWDDGCTSPWDDN